MDAEVEEIEVFDIKEISPVKVKKDREEPTK